MIFKSKSTKMTLPKTKKVHGIKIKKEPIGRYLECMGELQGLPAALLEACFPDKEPQQIIDELSLADKDVLVDLATRLMLNAPETIIDAFVIVTDTDRQELLNLTPKELLDVISAWWELNDLTSFFKDVWDKMRPKLQTIQP